MPRILPTERAMGLVTILSGLAIPIGILVGAGPMGAATPTAETFEKIMWVVNPFGMWAYPLGSGLFGIIGLYILGTAFSALLWGIIDALVRREE